MDTTLDTPLVSVVMTVYNAEKYVGQAIDSILDQTYAHFELLILNDASTDGSEKVILEKQGRDKRISYFKNEKNAGLSEGKNKLIPYAKGALIAIADADDVYMPHRLEAQVKFLADHKNIDVVGSSVKVINNKGELCDEWHYPGEDKDIKKGLENSLTLANPTAMFRRDVFFKIGGYDKNLVICEDWNFFERASRYFNFANLAEPLVYYRFHESNSSFTKLEAIVLYAVCFKNGLPGQCYKGSVTELVQKYPEYTAEVRYNLNRFYTFMMNTFLKLKYHTMSDSLYMRVKDTFFVFFDKPSKKRFIKSAISLHLKHGYLKPIPSLLIDYFF